MPQQDATCTGNYGKYYSQRLVVTIGSQDIQNNRTYVTLAAYLYCNNQYSGPYNNNATSTLTYYVDGGAVLSASVKYRTKTGGASGSAYTSSNPYQYLDGNDAAVVWSGYITHNSDGTKSFTAAVSTSLVGNTSLTGGTVSMTVTLPTIPRASIVTLSKANFSIGETITIYTNRASSSFTHKVELIYADVTKTLATGIQTSYSWDTSTDAATLYGQIPNKTSGGGLIRLTTYNGSTQIGTSTAAILANVTNSNPIISAASYTATRSDLTGDNQIIIKGQSDVTVTWLQASAQNYATISKYIVSVGSAQQTITDTTSEQLSATFYAVDGGRIDVVAVDSRGLQSSAPTLTAQVIPYTPLSITSEAAERENGVDSVTTLSYSGQMYNGSLGAFANALTACYYTYLSGSGEPVTGQTVITPTITADGKLSFSGPIWGDRQSDGFAVGGSYTITIYLSDRLMTVSQSITLNSGTPGMMLHRNSDGTYVFTVGKSPANGTKGIDVDLIYPVGSIYMTMAATSPADLFGGAWTRIAKGRMLVGVDDNDADFASSGLTGGEKQHTLTTAELPNHNLNTNYGLVKDSAIGSNGSTDYAFVRGTYSAFPATGSGNVSSSGTGGGQAHNNMPPYLACYIWQRTA